MRREYVNKETINKALFCTFCNLPFVNPLTFASCLHTFCEDCVNGIIQIKGSQCYDCEVCFHKENSFKNYFVSGILNEFEVHCINSECFFTGSLDKVRLHEKYCYFNMSKEERMINENKYDSSIYYTTIKQKNYDDIKDSIKDKAISNGEDIDNFNLLQNGDINNDNPNSINLGEEDNFNIILKDDKSISNLKDIVNKHKENDQIEPKDELSKENTITINFLNNITKENKENSTTNISNISKLDNNNNLIDYKEEKKQDDIYNLTKNPFNSIRSNENKLVPENNILNLEIKKNDNIKVDRNNINKDTNKEKIPNKELCHSNTVIKALKNIINDFK